LIEDFATSVNGILRLLTVTRDGRSYTFIDQIHAKGGNEEGLIGQNSNQVLISA
jgi:hypothetical protein